MKKKLTAIRYGSGGLVPAVVQERSTGRVLMLAYMNRRAVKETLESGRSVFWSRSRRQLWRKGDTSGHVQRVRSISMDCDGDTLLLQVDSAGPACHTGRVSCFFEHLKGRPSSPSSKRSRAAGDAEPPTDPPQNAGAVLERLDAVIRSRRHARPEKSYTARLFGAGLDRILRKVGEETTEVVVAAKNRDPQPLAEEAADLLYHLLVLLEERGVGLNGVTQVLERRHRGDQK
jgi:phosphoribosyl-ATP pyrophosphohydrolase/phosphoribosyl-AMP cyclohydrolase